MINIIKGSSAFAFILCLASSIGTFAQSSELRSTFNEIQTTLSKYSIDTEGVCKTEWHCYYTRSISASFSYPNLVFTYVEGYRDGGISGGEEPGTHKLIIPISSTTFSTNDSWDKVRGYLNMENSEGIEHIYKGKSNLTTSTYFRADKLVVDKLYSQIKRLQSLVDAEGFKGSIGQSASKNSKGSSQGGGSSTNSVQKSSKSGIYGQ